MVHRLVWLAVPNTQGATLLSKKIFSENLYKTRIVVLLFFLIFYMCCSESLGLCLVKMHKLCHMLISHMLEENG